MRKIVDPIKAGELRADFIKAFVDTLTDYYKELEKVKPADIVYDYVHRYLRDTLYWDNTAAIPFSSAVETIAGKKRVYSMWDIRPGKVINTSVPDLVAANPRCFELYESGTVIEWDAEELAALLERELGNHDGADCMNNTLPEDIYIFDDGFDWCVIFTHSDIEGERLCYICKRQTISSV